MINNTFNLVITGILTICIAFLCIAIIADFILFDHRKEVKKERRSIVATGTMSTFYIIYFISIRTGIMHLMIKEGWIERNLMAVGTCMVVLGTIINLSGRIQLKNNWSNHIKIYTDQTLITTGVFGLVRHPLYSSLMLMFYGGSLVYVNGLSFILTTFIFIPFMYYRAKQEEVLLKQEFSDYPVYQKKVGMFFPKLRR